MKTTPKQFKQISLGSFSQTKTSNQENLNEQVLHKIRELIDLTSVSGATHATEEKKKDTKGSIEQEDKGFSSLIR